jgi:nucleotide-binding universal stress UspA family protein
VSAPVSDRSVILTLDVPEHARAALPVAQRFAELFGGPLRIIHAANESLAATEALQRLGLDADQIGRAVFECRQGEPTAAITKAARDTDAALIVMCTHTGRLADDQVVDDAALAVLRGAPCPVVLVRPDRGEKPWTLSHVLLPHDGTPSTTAALHVVARFARSAESGSLTPRLYVDQPQHEWPAWQSEFLERLCWPGQDDPYAPRIFLAPGAAAEQVLRFASEHAADLIVLAWHGRWEEGRAAVAKEVLHHATCPVMLIRASE